MALSFCRTFLHPSTCDTSRSCLSGSPSSSNFQVTNQWSQKQKVRLFQQPAMKSVCSRSSSGLSIVCQSTEKDVVERSRSMQLSASALLAELLKAEDVRARIVENLDSINEEFFTIASTYVDMAVKEGNMEIVKNLQTTLQIAMEEKNKTLRPEIRLLNQLLAEKKSGERIKTIQSNLQYLEGDSYFFQLLNRFTLDVERQPDNPKKSELMVQIKSILRETKEASAGVKKTPKKGFGSK